MIDLAYPRLELDQMSMRVNELDLVPLEELREHSSTSLSGYRFREVSEAGRVDEPALVKLQARVREISDGLGFPTALSKDSARKLDQQLAAEILELLPMTVAEAASNEVWSFLGLMVLPELPYWRNPGTVGSTANLERRAGTPIRRSVLQRAWWKAKTLGPELAVQMNEEETVAVMERSFFGYSSLAHSFLSEHFVRVSAGNESGRQALVRTAAKLLVRRMMVVNVFALEADNMKAFIQGVYDDAQQIIGRRDSLGTEVSGNSAESATTDIPADRFDDSVTDQAGGQSVDENPLVFFRRSIGDDLWKFVEHASMPLTYERVFELQVAVQAHPIDSVFDVDLSRRLQFDLLSLLDVCSELSDDETSVVGAACHYFLLVDDAVPDHEMDGQKDDDQVIAAAFESLGRARL